MAKKRKEPEMPALVEPKLKPVRLDLTEEAHRLLRVISSMEGKSMSAYARDHVEEFVRAESKRRGVKLP
jgi:hypothetical protein